MCSAVTMTQSWMNKELERNCKKIACPNLKHYPRTCREGLTKTTKLSLRVTGLRVDIRTTDLPNTKTRSQQTNYKQISERTKWNIVNNLSKGYGWGMTWHFVSSITARTRSGTGSSVRSNHETDKEFCVLKRTDKAKLPLSPVSQLLLHHVKRSHKLRCEGNRLNYSTVGAPTIASSSGLNRNIPQTLVMRFSSSFPDSPEIAE
jgi:hypothetical protein